MIGIALVSVINHYHLFSDTLYIWMCSMRVCVCVCMIDSLVNLDVPGLKSSLLLKNMNCWATNTKYLFVVVKACVGPATLFG